jgi:hypothetical protein
MTDGLIDDENFKLNGAECLLALSAVEGVPSA